MFNRIVFLRLIVLSFFVAAPQLMSNQFENAQTPAGCCGMSQAAKDEASYSNDDLVGKCITAAERDTVNSRKWLVTCRGSKVMGYCHWSCFDPSIRVLVENLSTGKVDYVAVGHLPLDGSGYRIQTVFDGDTRNLPFEILACKTTEVLVFTAEDGSVLKVTPEHPVLRSPSEMVQARNLSVGHKLLNRLRQELEIKTIHTEMSSGEVLNILVDEQSHRSPHVIVAEGMLVGDAQWQRKLLGIEVEND